MCKIKNYLFGSMVLMLLMFISNNSMVSAMCCSNPSIHISSEENFKTFATDCNNGNDFKNKIITLDENITLPTNWIGIKGAFNGVFDGNDKTITFKILENDKTSTPNVNLSLFSTLGKDSKIQNLTIVESLQDGEKDFVICGIANENKGNISNVTINFDAIKAQSNNFSGIVNINSGTIIGCKVNGKIENLSGEISGICFKNDGKIENCEMNANLTISNDKISGEDTIIMYVINGVCCHNYGDILKCKVNGSIENSSESGWATKEAGIAQINHGFISECDFKGNITSCGSVGGLCIYNYEYIINCSVNGTLSGDVVGGLVVFNSISFKNVKLESIKKLSNGYIEESHFNGTINGSEKSNTIFNNINDFKQTESDVIYKDSIKKKILKKSSVLSPKFVNCHGKDEQ